MSRKRFSGQPAQECHDSDVMMVRSMILFPECESRLTLRTLCSCAVSWGWGGFGWVQSLGGSEPTF